MSAKVLELIDSLPNSQDKEAVLNDIKICLTSIHKLELKQAVPNVSFDVIFECLQTEKLAEVSVCCEVLEQLFSVCDVTYLLHQFHVHLLQGLNHPVPRVRELSLKQILIAAQSSPQQVTQYPDMLCKLVESVAEANLALAKLAMDTLVCLGTNIESLECMFSENPFNSFTTVINKGDEVRYRVYEVVVRIGKLSQEALQVTTSCGLLQRLIAEVQTDDILLQLNAVELLRQLAESDHGLNYLDQSGVISALERLLQDSDSNPMAGFLLPGVIKFFGSVARQYPKEMNGRLELFINTVFRQTESDDLSLKVIAMETLGFVGHSPEGKKALARQGNKMHVCCKYMGNTMQNSPVELKQRVYSAASELLHLQVPDQTTELLSLTESWYNSLATNPLQVTMNVLQQPMIQLRGCVMGLLTVLAEQPWGQRNLNNHPGFNEFLLDRSTETSKEGKEDKFCIVKTLVESPTALEIFGRVYFMKLKEFHNEGPFYVKVESSVAFERDQ